MVELIRAVIDTNTLVSPRLRESLQNAAEEGVFTAIWSPWIIAELNRVLTWRWIARSGGDLGPANWTRCGDSAKAMMELLLETFEFVDPRPPYPPPWETLTDLWDVPIWAAAVVGNAQYVVSENRRDYPPRQQDGRHVHQGIEYLSGHAFLNLLTDG